MAKYSKNQTLTHMEVTETRTGMWVIECPCGWFDSLGKHASLSIARDHARFHMRHCPVVRDQRKIGYETATQAWRERGAS